MQYQLADVLRQFALPHLTFRAGDALLKRIKETSLENNHSVQLIQWIAEFTSQLELRGFRLPQPIPTTNGRWITDDGWTAWKFIEGQHATADDIPLCIAGIPALNLALRTIPGSSYVGHSLA